MGGGLLLTSALLGVAQIENLNRVGMAGPEQGTVVHRVLVAPVVWGEGVGLGVGGRW